MPSDDLRDLLLSRRGCQSVRNAFHGLSRPPKRETRCADHEIMQREPSGCAHHRSPLPPTPHAVRTRRRRRRLVIIIIDIITVTLGTLRKGLQSPWLPRCEFRSCCDGWPIRSSQEADLTRHAFARWPHNSLSALNSMSSTLPRKCITSAVIFASGDALSQHAFERRAWSAHDYSRSARIAVHGGVGE